MKICSIEDCGKKLFARGWCSMHYSRWRNHGDPNGGSERRHSTPEESFAANTRKSDCGCTEWTAYIAPDGYGVLQAKGKLALAHRYAWERVNGPIPKGMHIDHICHNRACVNVDHLRPVTGKQNSEHRSGANSNSRSGYRGVYFHPHSGKWHAQVVHNRKAYSGGYHDTPEAANGAATNLRNKLFTHNNLDRV